MTDDGKPETPPTAAGPACASRWQDTQDTLDALHRAELARATTGELHADALLADLHQEMRNAHSAGENVLADLEWWFVRHGYPSIFNP